MKAFPQALDIEACAKVSWEAGILALIIQSRRDHPDLYAEWDKEGWEPKRFNIIGEPSPHMATQHALGQPFCIEAFYASPDAVDESQINANGPKNSTEATLVQMRCLKPQGPAPLWREVWKHAPRERRFLRMVAAGALAQASEPGDLESIRPAFEAQPADRLLVALVVARLPKGRASSYEYLKATFSSWRRVEPGLSINIIASVPSKEARQFLHELIMRETEDLGLRKAAARACCGKPVAEDLDVADRLIRLGGEDQLEIAVECLAFGSRSKEDARPGVRRILQVTQRRYTRVRALDYLLLEGEKEDLPALRHWIEKGDLITPEEGKSMWERLIKLEARWGKASSNADAATPDVEAGRVEAKERAEWEAFAKSLKTETFAKDFPGPLRDLDSGDEQKTLAALNVLGASGAIEAIPYLVPFLDSPRREIRVFAGLNLERVVSGIELRRWDTAHPDRLALLPRTPKDPDLTTLRWVVRRMLTSEDDGNTAAYAATMAAYIGLADLEEQLRSLLRSPHPAVTRSAVHALRTLGLAVDHEPHPLGNEPTDGPTPQPDTPTR
jgi:hypothetical protein